ncbi:MAG: hypothetical protein ACR2MK_11135 [Solirubrobacteraceae bacterium]
MKRIWLGIVAACGALACCAAPALAYSASYPGMEHLRFNAGPYSITPGANLILLDSNHVPKPHQDGYMVRMAPNLRYALPNGKCCGKVPLVNVIHLHHGVWLSDGAAGAGEGNSYTGLYPFMASGEEKTVYEFPRGYGYPIGANDLWILNYMIHNLTAKPAKVYIDYTIDLVPATDPAATGITPVHPIWMDVMSHHIYPVFDVHRYSGVNGKFTFPDMAKDPYGGGPPLNEFTIDHPGVLVGTAGHLHPGGLYDDLDLIRQGAHASGGAIPGTMPNSVRLFRSHAHYWDKRGPISWDMAMTATAPDWRPQVKAGDVLRISTTYDTRRASWYESMGIMVVWEAWNEQGGIDPFTRRLDQRGHVTHGHLAEDDDHGGAYSITGANPAKFPACFRRKVTISGFIFNPGDFTATGSNRCIPTIRQGQQLTFVNDDASPLFPGNPIAPTRAYMASVFHTVTACQNPCGLNTGISYPLANGRGNYDSGQLGLGTPAVGRLTWSTPTTLKPGTYTFFCRIHPFMRGVFRIVG